MAAAALDSWTLLIQESLGPFWVEFALVISFTVGFLVLRGDPPKGGTTRSKAAGGKTAEPEFSAQALKTIEAEAGAGNAAAVLAAWRGAKDSGLSPTEVLRVVVKAFMEVDPESMQSEIISHLRSRPGSYTPDHALAALDSAARCCTAESLEAFWAAIRQQLGVWNSSHSYSLLLGGFAAAGDESRVAAIIQEMREAGVRRSPRSYALTIKGFLKHGLIDAVRQQLHEMIAAGMDVPSFAIIQYTRIACEAHRAEEVFTDLTSKQVALPEEAVAYLLEDCFRRSDFTFADVVDGFVQAQGQSYSQEAQEALLKMYASAGDLRALKLFGDMQKTESRISEGLCVTLLSRCAETKFLRFAEEIVTFSRARKSMSIAAYSALMKVYAHSGMYHQACDLYGSIVSEGLEPDGTMYGCLMKFAVECGRTDLSRELSAKTPSMEIQNYMSLMRAAGRDKDALKALAVLQKLKESSIAMDIAAYNCALDAVVSAGDIRRAEALVEEIRGFQGPDMISYNTLLKGYCQKGCIGRAKELFKEMEADGHPPNDVSYNSVINACVCRGDIREAWAIVELMESKGVPIDHFTLSIMMKSLKKTKGTGDVRKILALLDRSGLDVASDEILLNAVLDTCIRHRELKRLEKVLATCLDGRLRPAVHTYGALIKACGSLKWVERCRELWQEMTQYREPNAVVLGCMLDTLVTNGLTDEAVALFRQWKTKVPPNCVMLSTLLKGFAAGHQSKKAMEMWREIRQDNVALNTIVYNALIDTQARVGAMDNVTELTNAMEQDGCRSDEITLSTIVKGHCVKGDLEAAFAVYAHMRQNGMANDSVIYNTLLDGCTKLERFELTDQLLEDMETLGVVPTNFTLGILAKMWGRRRRLDKAFQAMEELPRRWGFTPNAQVYSCLMCACLGNGAVDRAHEVFEMLKEFHGVDAKAYSTLISGCARFNDFQRGISLVREACGLSPEGGRGLPAGRELGPEAVELLLRTLVGKGLRNEALSLLQQLRGTKVVISRQVGTMVLGVKAAQTSER